MINKLIAEYPIIKNMASAQEIIWFNPHLKNFDEIEQGLPLSMKDINDAEERLQRFAPFIQKVFPDTKKTHGLIESPLREIAAMKTVLNTAHHSNISGRLFLKMDSHLAVAGSVKARGGIYEILKYAEELALSHDKISLDSNYEKFADDDMRKFFANYSIHVGSTGNLGLSIGIISAALGFKVNVHMSADAKQWKKDLLRSKGVNVIEYAGDYSQAVKHGRELAQHDPMSYFVDDENSQNLFLGYAVAAKRLQEQLKVQQISVDDTHPLFVYIPCGVGGAPGGITFGLKQLNKDNVYVFFAEPVQACCMALGMITGLHDKICVQDINLTGQTEADGLAVSRPSKFVGKTIYNMLAGEFTVDDKKIYRYMKELLDSEHIFIEPSSCAAFIAPEKIFHTDFLAKYNLAKNKSNITHIVWATGGSLVPEDIRKEYCSKAETEL